MVWLNSIISSQWWPLILLLLAALLIQLIYYWLIFSRLAFYNSAKRPVSETKPPVSVIICAKNEYHNLVRFLPKVLEQAGLTIDDIDIYEINEAFASQALYSIRELGIEKYMDRINIHGGAIALGHPLGCTGAKLTATCIANLKAANGKYGIVSMCIGGGMGAAAIFERL